MAKFSGEYAIPDEHVVLIGRISDAWAQFEFQIDRGIWHLADTEQQLAACITAQFQSVHPRLKAFAALIAVRNGSDESVKKAKKFYGEISGLIETRNRSVHDPRYVDRSTDEIHRLEITAKPRVTFEFTPEPKNELEATIEKIYEKLDEFMKLRDETLREIDELPEESLPTLVQIIPVHKAPPNQPNESQ